MDLANELPTIKEPNKPGPCVYATASNCFLSIFAFVSAFLTTFTILLICDLDATSGITPPCFLCSVCW